MRKRHMICAVCVLLCIGAGAQVFGEDGARPQESLNVVAESDIEWLWGEVTAVDPAAKIVTIKYLDYELDQEKEIVISTDDKTTYENIASFAEIKTSDTLSVDYSIAGQKNIARNISVEKADGEMSAQEEVSSSETSGSSEAPQAEVPAGT